jgi:hypothetical protein
MTKLPLLLLALSGAPIATASAETVDVKYRGPVDLKPLACADTQSSFVNRVCYDSANSYMLIQLQQTWYHYCSIDNGMVEALKSATSVGRYYNSNIKGRFDCRTKPVPAY